MFGNDRYEPVKRGKPAAITSAGSRSQADPYHRDRDELGGRVAIALDNRRDRHGTPHFHPVPAIGAFPAVAGCYPCDHAPTPATPHDVELAAVRTKLDELADVRLTTPLVGNDAKSFGRLCDRELLLLERRRAQPCS